MACTSGKVDKLSVTIFVSTCISIVSTLGNLACTSGTVDKLCVIAFVTISIVSTLGQSGVNLRCS